MAADTQGSAALDARRGLFVVSGTQGAGKSTVSRLLAARFERGVHVEADALQTMIVSGGVWPDASRASRDAPAVDGEAGRQLELRLRNMCLLGRSFFDAGFTAVLDDIVAGSRFGQLVEELRGRPFMFVMLAPDNAAVRARELARGTRLFDEWEWLSDEIRASTPRVGLWLDTSAQSAEETVDEIMRRAWTEGLVSETPVSEARA